MALPPTRLAPPHAAGPDDGRVLRRMVGGVLVVATLLVGGLAAWTWPGSPLLTWRADEALGLGQVTTAAELYDRVALHAPLASQRRAALRKVAFVYATDLHEPITARRRWMAYAALSDDPAEVAVAHEAVGHLLLTDERRPVPAAQAFVRAHDAAPDHAAAPARLASAARAWQEAGRWTAAHALWDRLAATHPTWTSVARLEQGQALLGRGKVQSALPYLDEVVAHGTDPSLVAVARLGVATCLERLGNLDGAIAEIDRSDLPSDVRDARVEAMRARRVAGSGRAP